MSINASDLVSL